MFHVFLRKAKTFNELRSKDFLNKITRKSCDIDEERVCEQIVDLVFLFDGSGSIDETDDFSKMKEFATRIANKFGISESGAHGGLVVFSDLIDVTKNKYYSKISVYLKVIYAVTVFHLVVYTYLREASAFIMGWFMAFLMVLNN